MSRFNTVISSNIEEWGTNGEITSCSKFAHWSEYGLVWKCTNPHQSLTSLDELPINPRGVNLYKTRWILCQNVKKFCFFDAFFSGSLRYHSVNMCAAWQLSKQNIFSIFHCCNNCIVKSTLRVSFFISDKLRKSFNFTYSNWKLFLQYLNR